MFLRSYFISVLFVWIFSSISVCVLALCLWSVCIFLHHCYKRSLLLCLLFLSSIKRKENSRRTSQPVSPWCSQTTAICWLGNKNRYRGIETSVSQSAGTLNQTTALCVFPHMTGLSPIGRLIFKSSITQ